MHYTSGRQVWQTSTCVQVLVGNKCDMDESKRVVPYSRGQALADEFGIQFFETSAKSNLKVDEVNHLSMQLCCKPILFDGACSVEPLMDA